MILKNKVYSDNEFLGLLRVFGTEYAKCHNIKPQRRYTIAHLNNIMDDIFHEALWEYPMCEADYLNEEHPEKVFVIVRALNHYGDVGFTVKRFFELPSNSAIINEALRNDLASTHFLMLGRHNCKSKMCDEIVKVRFNKAMDFTAWRDSSEYKDTDTVFADNLPASTVVLKGEDCYAKVILDTVKDYLNDEYGRPMEVKAMIKDYEKMQIEDVIYNPPATIVFWRDGSKTVVKAQDGELFDKEKGLAMAYVKKCCGNLGNYNDIFRKWCKED